MKLVLDASMALSWFFEDERDALSISALRHVNEHGALVPALWNVEIVHALVKSERRDRVSQEQTSLILDFLRAMPITVDRGSDEPSFAPLAFARKFELSGYAATYLDLAVRFGLPLATRDAKLASAADALGVALPLL